MTDPTALLDAEAFGVLVQLREQLWAFPPLRAHGHRIEMLGPDALRVDGGLVWLELRHRSPDGEVYEGRVALMHEGVLRRPDEAGMRARVWHRLASQVIERYFDRSADPGEPRSAPLVVLDVRTVAKAKRFATAEALHEAYGSSPRFGRWLPLPPYRTAGGESVEEVVERVLPEVRPLGGELVLLEPVPNRDDRWVHEAHPGVGLKVVMRLVIWDRDGDRQSIRDIKEQELLLLSSKAFFRVDRVEPYLRGWAAALQAVLATATHDVAGALLPIDFVFPEVMALARPRTCEDFRAAFLVRSRLGKLLPSS